MARRAFTLFEIVLAIALASSLMLLITTAIELYLVRVETSRSQVEAAQLARTILTKIADDLRAVRYEPSASSSQQAGGAAGGAGGAAGGAGGAGQTGGTSQSQFSTETAAVMGIFGNQTELRIDRSAIWNWQRLAHETELVEPTTLAEMPQTIIYSLGQGRAISADELAQQGISIDPATTTFSGLYRRQLPSAVTKQQSISVGVNVPQTDVDEVVLLAPEVLDLQIAYYDGSQLLSEWDTVANEGLPVAVEIRLWVWVEPNSIQSDRPASSLLDNRSLDDAIEYRLFVRLPVLDAATEAPPPTVQEEEGEQVEP